MNNKKSKVILHFIAIVLTVITIVSLALGLFAWSKYTATQSGNATAQVAKWNFNLSLKSGNTSVTGNSSLNLADTLDQEATHVSDGKIAPGTSGTFDIELDTRGTEVSMVYDITLGMSNCPRNITFSKKGPGESEFTVISAAQTGDETQRARTVNFSKDLTLNEVTAANTNDTKFVETIKWEWPYELTGNDPATNQPYTAAQKTAYDLRDNADQGRTITIDITATGTETMAAPGTPVSDITDSDYGKYVNLNTNILGNLNNITLSDDSHPLADWRVFNKDENGVWLILSDSMPGSAFDITNAGLQYSVENDIIYGVYIPEGTQNKRVTLVNGLKGTLANKSWNGLLNNSSLSEGNGLKSGVRIQGAPDVETWIASWNKQCTPTLYYSTEAMNDGLNGYYIGDRENPSSVKYTLTAAQRSNTLFFPHTSAQSDHWGYWLAAASTYYGSTAYMEAVEYSVGITYTGYFNEGCKVRPVVYLPNSINLDTSGTVWTVIE